MELSRIAELLRPFLIAPLAETQLEYISAYIDLLLRWNARINLTAVRQPEEIVTRHFGESLFAARHLFADDHRPSLGRPEQSEGTDDRLIDLGSGAGFPGLPIKIWRPDLRVTLIESNQKKATFLREVARSLELKDVAVFGGRAEGYSGDRAGVVTLRAVERFEEALSVASHLVALGGRIVLLIGQAQCAAAREALPRHKWDEPVPIPHSQSRVLFVGHAAGEPG
jgi:16S rRNA (guanine527-N7)-methyltransferase